MTAFDAARACDIGRLRVGDLQQQGLRHGERGALDERERGIDREATEAEDKGIEWVFIGNCPLVQVSIVLHRAEFAIFLANQKEATGVGRFRSTNSLETKVLREELSLFLLFFRR